MLKGRTPYAIMLDEHRLGARCTIAKQQQRLFSWLVSYQDMMVEAWLARADSLASQLARTIFFASQNFAISSVAFAMTRMPAMPTPCAAQLRIL